MPQSHKMITIPTVWHGILYYATWNTLPWVPVCEDVSESSALGIHVYKTAVQEAPEMLWAWRRTTIDVHNRGIFSSVLLPLFSSLLMHVFIPIRHLSIHFLYSTCKWFRRFLLFLWSSKGLSLPRSPLMGLCMFCRLCICLRSLQYWCMANVSAGLKADTRALGCSEAAQPHGECLLLRALTRAALRIWRRILASVRLKPFSVARQ